MTNRACTFLAATLCTLATAGSAVAQSQIINLGILPGAASATARGISADGSTVVGNVTSATGVNTAFRWTQNEGIQEFGDGIAFTPTVAGAASADGTYIVGGASFAGGLQHAFRWSMQSGAQDLGALPGGSFTAATDISADGSVVIGNGDSNLGGFRGFHWTESGRTIVAPPVVTHDSYAYGLSADGVYVAAASRYLSGVQWKSFRWHAPNVIEQLPFPSGAEHVIAASISGDGTTIIGHTYILGKQRAFRWTAAAGLVNIDAQAPASRVRSYAQAVNHNGSVIVGTLETTQAFVWTAANGLFELAPYLQSHGTDLTGWTLAEARGISADGSAIAGTGFFQGQKRAFLVRGLHLIACGIADVGGVGGTIGNDGVLDNNDFVAFITLFFAHDPRADVGAQGGALGPDGLFDNNDFVVYIDSFFDGC